MSRLLTNHQLFHRPQRPFPTLPGGVNQVDHHQLDGKDTSLTKHLPGIPPHLLDTPLISQARGKGADLAPCLHQQDQDPLHQ